MVCAVLQLKHYRPDQKVQMRAAEVYGRLKALFLHPNKVPRPPARKRGVAVVGGIRKRPGQGKGIRDPATRVHTPQLLKKLNTAVVPEAKPDEGANKPVEGADKPVEGADKPVEGADKPVEGADKPVETPSGEGSTVKTEPVEVSLYCRVFQPLFVTTTRNLLSCSLHPYPPPLLLQMYPVPLLLPFVAVHGKL